MKKYIFFCFIITLLFHNSVSAQKNDSIDVVYLKSGKVIKGYVIENTPDVEIKFKTIDGSLIIYSYEDFHKIQKEKHTYIIKNQREKIIYEKETFMVGGIALHPSQTSGFLMVGKMKNFGGFMKLKTNLNFNGSYVTEGSSWSNRYFNENIYSGRFGITTGVLWRATKPLILYGGLGYGNRWVNWETISSQRFRVNDISYQGLEFETGLMFKIGKFFAAGGVSTISFKYMELNLGLGIKL